MLRVLKKLPFKALGWGVAALAAVVIGLFVFNQTGTPPRTAPEMKQASISIFRAKMPAVVDSATPKFVNRAAPAPKETTARDSEESTEAPPKVAPPDTLAKTEPAPKETAVRDLEESTEASPKVVPPEALAKTEPPPMEKEQKKPPPIKRVVAKKEAQKNSIYRESWLLDQDSSYYTLQVLGVRNEESLLAFIKRHQLLQIKNVAYYKTAYKGKQWYPLLYGVYPTKSDAAEAVKELPDKVQKSIPWIRKVSVVQKEVRTEANR